MTSMPASRSARAMIFAPRSCPSRPGFATTTLIFPATVGQYRNVKLTVVGCSPAWPNPGGAHSGYLLEHDGGRLLVDCGPGVLVAAARSGGLAARRRDRDHAHAPRPLRRPRRVAVGPAARARAGDARRPKLWLPPGGRDDLDRPRVAIRRGLRDRRVRGARRRSRPPASRVTPQRVAHYDAADLGLPGRGGRQDRGASRPTRPDAGALRELAADADVFLCEATLDEGEPARVVT